MALVMMEGLTKRDERGRHRVQTGDIADAKEALANHDSYRDTYYIMKPIDEDLPEEFKTHEMEHVGTLYLWRANNVPRAEAKGVLILRHPSNSQQNEEQLSIGSYETVGFNYKEAKSVSTEKVVVASDKRHLLVNKLMIANRDELKAKFGIDLSFITEESEPDAWIPAFLEAGYRVYHVALDPAGVIGGSEKW